LISRRAPKGGFQGSISGCRGSRKNVKGTNGGCNQIKLGRSKSVAELKINPSNTVAKIMAAIT
jgi:hypothetical protein